MRAEKISGTISAIPSSRKKEGEIMKEKIARSIAAVTFMFTLTGMSFGLLSLGTAEKAHAWGHKGDHHYIGGGGRPEVPSPDPGAHSVPEPSLLALAASALGGFGIYSLIRRNKEK